MGLIFISGCGPDVDLDGLGRYYFPIEELGDGKVYIYTSEIDVRHPQEIWLFSKEIIQNKIYLISKNIDRLNRITLDQTESIVSNGTLLHQLRLFSYDSLNNRTLVEADILGANVYPYQWADTNNVLFYRISYPEPEEDGGQTGLIKNRAFGRFLNYTFKDKTYKAVQINTDERIISDGDGSIEISVQSEEIYAEGIGRISFKKMVNGELAIHYKLDHIQSLADYELENGEILNTSH